MKVTIGRRLIDVFTMFIVTTLSLLLLIYVSYGDSKRTYEQLHIEKLVANGRVVQNSIEKFLRDGLPLKQYAGFTTLAAPMVESEDMDAMSVFDQQGRRIFQVADKLGPKLIDPPAILKDIKKKIEIEYGPTHYQVVIPLQTRFETAGGLVIDSPTRVVSDRLAAVFYPLLYVAIGLSAVFSIILFFALPHFARSRIPWLQIGYGLTFLIMSAAVISTLVSLYYAGVQDKSRAAAVTLSQRLSDIITFKLQFRDIEGLDKTLGEFRNVNSEIKDVALTEHGRVAVTLEPGKLDKSWASDQNNFEYRIELSQTETKRGADLVVTVPRDVVFERVIRSVKNFAALFVASVFLAGLFLQVAASLQGLRSKNSSGEAKPAFDDAALIIVKPIFFLAVFFDSLTYSFLPKFMQEVSVASGHSISFASVPFTAYYLCFALTLLPAGNLAERHGPKPLILIGLMLAGASVAAMFLPLGINELTVLRGIAGIGQGALIIGVQTYILAVASPEKKTQGAAIIVFGFQGGMIAGMALGSLLVNQVGFKGVFAIAGAVSIAAIAYTLLLLPRAEPKVQAKAGLKAAVGKLYGDIKNVITNLEFLKVMLCIGIPAKAILTGIVTFAMPLLLGQYGYRSEDIGQIIMLYGLGVIVATGYASRVVDRKKNSETVLFWGAIMSGVGLMMIGLMGSKLLGTGPVSTITVIAGTILVGIAHGFINAPVVTHIGQIALAKRTGAAPVTTSYRFLERIGHVAGPFIMAQLFLHWGQGAHVVIWVGLVTTALGAVFVAYHLWPQARAAAPEVVK